jgi:hypothetical protein
MRVSDTFPSKHLAAADLNDRELTLTITDVAEHPFDDGPKLVVSFREQRKTLVCNKTNSRTIATLHGDDCGGWVGQKITLFSTFVDFQGRQVPAIRVKPRSPQPRFQSAERPLRRATPGPDAADEEDIVF